MLAAASSGCKSRFFILFAIDRDWFEIFGVEYGVAFDAVNVVDAVPAVDELSALVRAG